MKPNQKLYVVTRRDLPAGSRAVQAGHALVQFAVLEREKMEIWARESNYLAFLTVEDEKALRKLKDKADKRGLVFTTFREPDMDSQLTAIAIEPHEDSERVCRDLPLLE